MLNKDFKEFIELLNDNNVKYLIVGGYAVAFHGHPRYTKDLDIWIEASPENAQRLLNALDQFGFGSLGLELKDFVAIDRVIQLGYPPNRIDLLTTAAGLNFGKCYASKVSEYINGIRIDFVDIANLKRNKRAAGRSQDLADLENLE
ncbi:MAG: hypothetical protein J7K30_12370 [Deltaproteobacteria bacterium]|nr:hypothetical protein [Deltaproteobacteria bacterium]